MNQDDFKAYQDEFTSTMWRGVGFTRELPGGGNADDDGDTDAIASHRPATRVVVGPKGLLEKGNQT